MISARGLTKRYGDTLAVYNLTFDIHPGTVTGFLGPNGSGKSDRVLVIAGGRLRADTTVAELAARAGGSLEDAFLTLTEGIV